MRKYLVFLCILGLGLISPVFSQFSRLGNFGNAMNGGQFVTLDEGYQSWVCAYDENSVRVFHPQSGAEAPFSPIRRGKDATGTYVNMYQPSGAACGTNGIVYVVCDNATQRHVFKFDSASGQALNGFTLPFRAGDIDVDDQGRLYITEKVSTTDRVKFHIYTAAGTEYPGSPVSLSSPSTRTYITRGIGVRKDGSAVYLANETENLVWKFTGGFSNGTAQFTQSTVLSSDTGSPSACEVDLKGNVYVSYTGGNQIKIFDASNQLTQTLNTQAPRGTAFHPNSQALYTASFLAQTTLSKWQTPQDEKLCVIGYHNVTASWGPNVDYGLTLSTEIFKDHLEWMQRHNYNTITLDTLYSYIMKGTPLPPNPVVISFDDNYRGESVFGGALLAEKQMHGVIFAHTGSVGGTGASYGPNGTWSELSTAEKTGYIKVESHQINHYNLSTYNQSICWAQMSTARKVLQQNTYTGVCDFMAYPYGTDTYSKDSVSLPGLAARAGYNMSFSYAGGFGYASSPLHNFPRLVGKGYQTQKDFAQMLGYTGSRVADDPYIVNNDGRADFSTTATGNWTVTTIATNLHRGYYGDNYLTAPATGGTNSYTFQTNFTQAGRYQVYGWWSADTVHADNTRLTIQHNLGTTTLNVNQKTDGYRWVNLGDYTFPAGLQNSVTISNAGANGLVVADAIKFVPLTPAAVEDFSHYQE